jgi:hypothetical protein
MPFVCAPSTVSASYQQDYSWFQYAREAPRHCIADAHCGRLHCRLQLPGFGLPLAQHVPAGAHYAADSSLQQSLQQSRRVGELLLKAEEQEVAAVRQHADELIGRYRCAAAAGKLAALHAQSLTRLNRSISGCVLQCRRRHAGSRNRS